VQSINVEFAPYFRHFNISFFWEQRLTTIDTMREYIVKESSAAPILPEIERSGIPEIHDNLCTFEAREAPGYATVVSSLIRWTKAAPELIENRWRSEKEMQRILRQQEADELMMD